MSPSRAAFRRRTPSIASPSIAVAFHSAARVISARRRTSGLSSSGRPGPGRGWPIARQALVGLRPAASRRRRRTARGTRRLVAVRDDESPTSTTLSVVIEVVLIQSCHGEVLRTSRSFAAKASGSPVWPYSPPRKPPWSLGKGTDSVPAARRRRTRRGWPCALLAAGGHDDPRRRALQGIEVRLVVHGADECQPEQRVGASRRPRSACRTSRDPAPAASRSRPGTRPGG